MEAKHLKNNYCQIIFVSRECHGFRRTKKDNYFELLLAIFEEFVIFEAAGAVSKIGPGLKSNHHIGQVKDFPNP